MNVLEMARDGLRLEVAAGLRRVKAQKKAVAYQGLIVPYNGGHITVTLSLRPVTARPDGTNNMYLIAFEEATPPGAAPSKKKGVARKAENEKIKHLEKELQLTKENLQITIEELETSNEELKSTNEELQSTNEELQSANEELETSKEEQQSLNEELTTVNSELQGKIDELIHANNDMKNLLNSFNIPTIFLDMDMCIKRFTTHATRVINLIQTDIGRPLADLVNKIRYFSLIDDAREVLKDLVQREKEVETEEGDWFLMKIVPYRTMENVIDGVVITFQDLGDCKRLEHDKREGEKRLMELRGLAEQDPRPVLDIYIESGVVWFANANARTLFGLPPEGKGAPVDEDLLSMVRKLVKEGKNSGDFEYARRDAGYRLDVRISVNGELARLYFSRSAKPELGPDTP